MKVLTQSINGDVRIWYYGDLISAEGNLDIECVVSFVGGFAIHNLLPPDMFDPSEVVEVTNVFSDTWIIRNSTDALDAIVEKWASNGHGVPQEQPTPEEPSNLISLDGAPLQQSSFKLVTP